jgi:hypothetical protein
LKRDGGEFVTETDNSDQRRDDLELSRLGYAQELFRSMGGFSNFAISFSIISILTGAVTLYGYGLRMGGPAQMALGWPLVAFFTLMVVMSMAELASSLPTSGAMYHWSARLGGKGWGWLTAWLNIVGQIAAIAGIDYGCALFLTPLLGMRVDDREPAAGLWWHTDLAWVDQPFRDSAGRAAERSQRDGSYCRGAGDRRRAADLRAAAAGWFLSDAGDE